MVRSGLDPENKRTRAGGVPEMDTDEFKDDKCGNQRKRVPPELLNCSALYTLAGQLSLPR